MGSRTEENGRGMKRGKKGRGESKAGSGKRVRLVLTSTTRTML